MTRMQRTDHGEKVGRSISHIRRVPAIGVASAFLLGAALAAHGCAPTQSSAPVVRPQSVDPASEDGGYPVLPSTRKGIIVPSDVGFGDHSPGNAPSTGTSGGSAAQRPLDTTRGSGN